MDWKILSTSHNFMTWSAASLVTQKCKFLFCFTQQIICFCSFILYFSVPPLGFGTAGLHPDDRLPAILTALDSGYRCESKRYVCCNCHSSGYWHVFSDYRLFDTAQIYGSEAPLAAAIKERNIPREDVTIVTKLHPQYHGYDSTIFAVQESLKNLQTDYIDVFLIHTKYCDNGYFRCPEGLTMILTSDFSLVCLVWKYASKTRLILSSRKYGLSRISTESI